MRMRVNAERVALGKENETLRARLREHEETLRAIRTGEVDALVVESAGADQVFTLSSADQTYRLMVEEMPTGAATLSADGLVLYCNSFFAELLKVPLETVVGAPLSLFLGEQSLSPTGLIVPDANHGISRGEVSFRQGEGSVATHVSITLLPLAGAPVFCMIVTDLTERKRREEERSQLERERVARLAAEEAIRSAEAEIERRKAVEESLHQAGKERTELLERERMARTEAEQANLLKDEFLATLSHELRTPLGAILTWSHVLRQPGLDPTIASRAVDAIDRNARAQALLVADILDVSRIVTGKFHMSLGLVWLSDVVELAVDTVRTAAQARGVRLELTFDPEAGPVMGDAGRLQQVLWNLLSNAIRLAPTGGRVELRVAAEGSYVELSVTDDGSGIDPAFLPYVFDRFRQADSSSTRRHAGLGLGLAIVRHLVELHGGTVAARNREDRSGALFLVRLPRAPEISAAPARADSDESTYRAPPQAAPSLHDVSILLVDDEEDAREAMAVALSQCGARVKIASSAQQAFDFLLEQRPDVLIADIGMPGEDGYSLVRRLRALPEEKGGATPAIALTAYAGPQNRLDALRSGFQLHVTKPVSPPELASAVANLLVASRKTG